ncbi:MAG: histidine kinase [Nitrosomonas sp.]|nr:histidine kinase [Nitrosomonas sp.]MDP1951454.1 histidine kinase [Nitrosomonas sp.]
MLLTLNERKISIMGGLLLMGLTLTLTTGIAVYGVMKQQIESTLGRGLDVALQGKAHLLESQIEKGLADTHAVVTRPFLVQTIQQLNEYPGRNDALHDLQRNIDSLLLTGFTAATVYDRHGNELSHVGHFSRKQAQSLPLNQQNSTALLWDGQFILRTSEDTFDQNGHRIGSILTESALPQLTRSFSEIRSIGKTGEFILCAPPVEGKQTMACLMSQIEGVKFKHMSHATGDEIRPMNYALEGRSGVMAVKDYRQVPVIEAYAPLSATGLGMALKLDEEELLKPVAEQLKIIILSLAGLIIAEILLLNWFVRKLIRSEREARNAKGKVEQFSVELNHKEFELRERLKEITCLYDIRRSIGQELSIDKVCQQIFSHLIPAMQYPENASVVIELDGKRFASENPYQGPTHELQSQICVNDKVCGQLKVFYPEDKSFLVLEQQRLIDAIVNDLERWLERKQIDQLLRERLKEITCLYEIRRGMGLELSVDNVCQNIFEHLIPALQFPEIATAVIELDGWKFISGKYSQDLMCPLQSKIKLTDKVRDYWRAARDPACTCWSEISVNGKTCGQLRVFYQEDKPYLVQEEQKLVNAIASDLENWLERKRLEQALVFVAEEQSHVIGQELHDNLGQRIAAIGYQARALEKKIFASGSVDMATVAASIASQAQIAVIQIKQLAQGLLPFELEANGLITALQTLASRIATTYDITCDFSCKNGIHINDNNFALNLYRIAQEAANNAIRHGGAQHLIISLTAREGMLGLSICDDGCGFSGVGTELEATSGMGIKIMQYRARQLGAKLEFLSRPEGGTEVRLEMRMV